MKLTKYFLSFSHFSIPKCSNRKNLGPDLLVSEPALLGHLHALLSHDPLLLVVVKDGGHVLPRALGGGIVVLPKHLEQLAVVGLIGVVLDLDGLGVVAQVVVGRLVLLAPRITDLSSDDSIGTSKLGLGEPKSGHGEGGLLSGHRGFQQRHGWSSQTASLNKEEN